MKTALASRIAAYVLETWLDGKDGVDLSEIATAIHVPVVHVRQSVLDGVPDICTPVITQAGIIRIGKYRPSDDAIRAEFQRLHEEIDDKTSHIMDLDLILQDMEKMRPLKMLLGSVDPSSPSLAKLHVEILMFANRIERLVAAAKETP